MAMNMASVATTGGEPDDPHEDAVDEADERPPRPIAARSRGRSWPVICPSPDEEREDHDHEARSGPTDRSMPPVEEHDQLPDADEDERAREEEHAVDAELAEEVC